MLRYEYVRLNMYIQRQIMKTESYFLSSGNNAKQNKISDNFFKMLTQHFKILQGSWKKNDLFLL